MSLSRSCVGLSRACGFSKYSTRQGDKSAKRALNGLLSLLAPSHIRDSESHALGQGCREKGVSTQGRSWLSILRSVEEQTSKKEEKRATCVLPSSVGRPSGPLVQRGDKSAKSPNP